MKVKIRFCSKIGMKLFYIFWQSLRKLLKNSKNVTMKSPTRTYFYLIILRAFILIEIMYIDEKSH